jgi:hypothetical protein
MPPLAATLDVIQVVISACIPLAIFGAGALLARQARGRMKKVSSFAANGTTRVLSAGSRFLLC